jgi:hypothetical protein
MVLEFTDFGLFFGNIEEFGKKILVRLWETSEVCFHRGLRGSEVD